MKELFRFDTQEETVTRGKFQGHVSVFSYGVGAEKYSWNIFKVDVDGDSGSDKRPPKGLKWFSSFEFLLPRLAEFDDIDVKLAIDKIIDELSLMSSKNSDKLKEEVSGIDDLAVVGKKITDYYECNYNRTTDNPRAGHLYKKLFKAEAEDD